MYLGVDNAIYTEKSKTLIKTKKITKKTQKAHNSSFSIFASSLSFIISFASL